MGDGGTTADAGWGRRRVGEPAPLGAWIWKKARERGHTQRTRFAALLPVTYNAFNAWSNARVAAVPDRRALAELRRILALDATENAELDATIREQEEFRRALSGPEVGTPREVIVEAARSMAPATAPAQGGARRTNLSQRLTLADRLELLVEMKAGGSARALGRLVGLPEAQITMIITRERAHEVEREAHRDAHRRGGVSLDLVTRIADGAGVSRAWLAWGEGSVSR